MRLWLLRQAHPDLSKLELEVSTSCLSKISLLRLLLGQTNRDKDFPESLRYSVRPNNYGTGVGLATNNNGQFIYSGWSGALTPKNNAWSGYERQPDQTNRDFGTEFELNFSKGNAIYSDSISTVQVDALLGQYLIRYAA